MKNPLFLNLAWAGVAGAAFYTGWSMHQKTDEVATSGKTSPSVQQSTTGPARESKGVNPIFVSKDSSLLAFYRQFGLDTGVPLTPEKMQEAVLMAIRESDPVKSQMMFARLMEELTPENAPAIFATIRENTGGFDSMRYLGMLAYKWGEADPVTAMAELSKNGGREGGMARNAALTGWGAKDPDAAIKWLSAYEGEDKGWLSMSIVGGIARADIGKATDYAMSLTDEGDKTRAAEQIARELVRAGGMEKATAWLNGIKDEGMKRGAFQTVAEQMMRSDPEKAAELVKAHADQEYASRAIPEVASSLARQDVKKGLDFANSLTGENQARSVAQVVDQWMEKDDGAQAEAASTYVTSLPAGQVRDHASSEIAKDRTLIREDPSTALQWAGSIGDAEMRSETTIDVARRWMREDREAATQWLTTSGLTPEQQQSVQQPGRWDRGDWGGGRGPGGGGPGGRGR